ncbi:MAG: response regulator [Minicystis sp.]
MSNALKFTDRGEVVVRAMLAASAADDVVVRFEVNDTGVGISAEKQARLFQPFSQVHEGSARGGSGLGLALARQIVQAMGGTIGVESAEGKGSRFSFHARFERRSPHGSRFEGLKPRRPEDAIPRVDVAGRRVLSAAPNAAVRACLGEMIDALGVEHEGAASGAGAIEALREAARAGTPYDVALLDVGLPGASDLFHTLDTDAMFAGLPVVLLAYPGQHLREDDRGAAGGIATAGTGKSSPRGAVRPVGHLAKPVRRAQLFSCLRTLMGGAVETVASDPKRHDAAPDSRRGGPGSRPRSRGDEARVAVASAIDPAMSSPRASSVSFAAPSSPSASETLVVSDRPLVLLVEDNAVNQRVGKVMIEKRGYRVDVASDGHEAVAATARIAYAAVLMDCQMPRLDGYAATREIRARDAGKPRLPIIAMTANAGPGARERCLAAGMDDYVAKPVTPDRIDEILRRWVPLPGVPAPAPSQPQRRPSSPVIDLGMLHQLRTTQRAGEPDIVAEVVALFLQDVEPRMRAIRAAIAAGDLASAALTVHTLKGSASHLGAKTLGAMCARFEDKVRTGAAFNATFAADAIEEELDCVRNALGREMKKDGG